jgi:AAA15 family ATPase/GTPase
VIQEFSVENIYSIKTRQTISFEASGTAPDPNHYCMTIDGKNLLKMAALYGSNASGKSNMLNALEFFLGFILASFSELKPKEDTGFMPFLFDKETLKMPGYFEIIFFMNKTKYEYALSLDARCVHRERLSYSPKGQKKLLFERTCSNCNDDGRNFIYQYKWGDAFTGAKKNIADMTRANATLLNTAAQLNHPEISKIYNWLITHCPPSIRPVNQDLLTYTFNQIEENKNMKKEILTLLAKSDFGHINDFVIKDEELPASITEHFPDGKYTAKEIYFSHNYEGNYMLPIEDESRGTLRFLELTGPLIEIIKNTKFLCIDEIELSLHQELLEFFIKTFLENSSGSQILFTTHHQDLLDSELLRDDEVWFVQKGGDGGSEYSSLIEYKGIRKKASRKKLYQAGKFGALPIISNYTSES